MSEAPLSSRIRAALERYGERAVVEDGGAGWQQSGSQMVRSAAAVRECLKPHAHRPLIAYLHKSRLYYAFTACAFLHRLDFCPLDVDNPIERVLGVADQLEDPLIICDRPELLARLRERTEHCLDLEAALQDFRDAPQSSDDTPGRDVPRYFIATSGSTGTPKLVQVPHDRTLPFIDWAVPFYGIDEDCRWAQFSSIGFDLSLVDFLSVVCGGGTLIALATPLDRIRPAQAVLRNRITHWHSVPSMIPYFLREGEEGPSPSTCRLFTFCGEPLMTSDVEQLAARYPGARIVNTYGPTETTLFCSAYEHGCGHVTTESSLPIGPPIPSWNFVLLPEDGAQKLVIVSDNVSDGYVGWRSERFGTVDLFGRSMRCFDTGDYFRSVGTDLHFSHRKDGMVKIKGTRIDLGEVEAAAKKAGLTNPVAMVVDNAIALAAEGAARPIAELLAALARYLPREGLPARVRFVPHHPRTINGKLHRSAIRDAFREADGS